MAMVCAAQAQCGVLKPSKSFPRPASDAVSDNGRFLLKFKEAQPFANDRSCFDQLDEPVVVQVAARQDDGTWADAPSVEFDVSGLLDVEWQPRDWDGPFPVASNDEYGLACGPPRLFIDNSGETVAMALPDVGAVLTATRRNTTAWQQLDLLRESGDFVLENHPTKLGEAKGKVVGSLFGHDVDFDARTAVLAVSAAAASGSAGKVHLFHLAVDEEWERWDVLAPEAGDPGKPDGFGQMLAVGPLHHVVIGSDDHVIVVELNATDGAETYRGYVAMDGVTRISVKTREDYDGGEDLWLDLSSPSGSMSGPWAREFGSDQLSRLPGSRFIAANAGSYYPGVHVAEVDGLLVIIMDDVQTDLVLPSGRIPWQSTSRVLFDNELTAVVWTESSIHFFQYEAGNYRYHGQDISGAPAALGLLGLTLLVALIAPCMGFGRHKRAAAGCWGAIYAAAVGMHLWLIGVLVAYQDADFPPHEIKTVAICAWSGLLTPFVVVAVLGTLLLVPPVTIMLRAQEWAGPTRVQTALLLLGAALWAAAAVIAGLMWRASVNDYLARPDVRFDGDWAVMTDVIPVSAMGITAIAILSAPCMLHAMRKSGRLRAALEQAATTSKANY